MRAGVVPEMPWPQQSSKGAKAHDPLADAAVNCGCGTFYAARARARPGLNAARRVLPMNPPKSQASVRAFVAIHLPPALLRALGDLTARLRPRLDGTSARWSRPSQIHLTLRFLGGVAAESIPELTAALREACAGFPRLDLRARGLGTFPNSKRPRVLWVGLGGDIDQLLRLEQSIGRACRPWSSSREQPFKPHLTLARFAEPGRADAHRLQPLLREFGSYDAGTWVAEEVSLMRSDLTPEGAVHTRLAAFPLGG